MEINKIVLLPLIVLMMALNYSCSKTTDDAGIADEPVVISYLMPGQPISVKVYEQKALADTASYGPLISGLQLSITDGSQAIALTESAAGTYTSNNSSFLVAGKTYTLHFNYQDKPVSASTLMPSKPTGYRASVTTINLSLSLGALGSADSVVSTFHWNNPDSLYHVLVFKNDDSSPFQLRPRTNSPINFTLNAERNAAYDVYNRTFNYLGTYRAILYRVNKEYINLLNSATSSTSKNLTNPPTNVIGGLGIFTAMQSDTLKLTLTQY